jgi:hypothetical protein
MANGRGVQPIYKGGLVSQRARAKSFQRIFNTATIIFLLINGTNTNNVSRIKGENVMNTEEIMELSLKLAGLKEVPEDSAIYVSGDNIRKVHVISLQLEPRLA